MTGQIITQLDPLTQHDFRPSHARRPVWVLEAQAQAREAWLRVDRLTDQGLAAGAFDWPAIHEAQRQARQAQQRAEYCLEAWQAGYEPADLPIQVSIDITVELPL